MTLLIVWKFWTNQLWGRTPVSSLRRGRAASPAAPRPTARLKVRLGLCGEKVLPMWGKKTSSKLLTICILSALTSHVEPRLSERSRVLGVYFCSSSQRNSSFMETWFWSLVHVWIWMLNDDRWTWRHRLFLLMLQTTSLWTWWMMSDMMSLCCFCDVWYSSVTVVRIDWLR